MTARLRLVPLILAALLLWIVGAPALLAEDDGRGRYRIKELAKDIEHYAEEAKSEARRQGHHGHGERSGHLIGALDDLEDHADHYQDAVRGQRSLEHTYDDFRGLVHAYQVAQDALQRSRGNRAVTRELYQVGRLLEEVNREYSRGYGPTRGGYNGRYDDRYHDRYDDRDRRDDNWRQRRGKRGGVLIGVPRIRIPLPF